MRYDKLVGDKIPERIIDNGGDSVFHIADIEEYWQKLKEKLPEEFAEFVGDESIEEFADMEAVMDAIAAHKGFTREDIDRAKAKKAEARGLFERRIILEEA
jgi:predicted house-cleaning noncanonical NTP pyrophosphatase (MazG superfamily)